MRSCVTISLVPTLAGGPWVYCHPLEESLAKASAAGFDAVELFTDHTEGVAVGTLRSLLDQHGLNLAAVGTGAGKVLHGWTLTDADEQVRLRARDYIRKLIDFGAPFGASAIIGSMQGLVPKGEERARSLDWLAAELQELDRAAGEQGVKLIYEPLNRYETNVFNRVGDAADFLAQRELKNTCVLADLFHMNMEETSIEQTILDYGNAIGYLHFADSNRHPVGLGHTDMAPISSALKRICYQGYVSAEAMAYPNPDAAAAHIMKSFREWCT
jgi:sugar phosphate isomerase/epimerase